MAVLVPDPATILGPVGLLIGLVLAAYPERRALLRLPRWSRQRSTASLAAALATPFLVVNVWSNVGRQLANLAPHAELGHWAGAAALGLALLLCTWLAESQVPGARTLAAVIGVTWLYLGVAALVLPEHDGSWGVLGGVFGWGWARCSPGGS